MKIGDRFTYQTEDEGLLHCEVTSTDEDGSVYFTSDEGVASYLTKQELDENAEFITMVEES